MPLRFFATLLACVTVAARPPNILHILADDFGWSQIGYHQPPGTVDVQTPNLDALAAGGLILDRFYVHTICSPSRCAFQTGRAPIHVNVQNVIPEVYNPNDLQGGYQGAPPNMTGIAVLMKRGGYDTFAIGKYDVGMATPRHTPLARGYDSFFGYWHHSNGYWSQAIETCPGSNVTMHDLWEANATHSGPARSFANSALCSQSDQNATPCVYEEALLSRRVQQVLESRSPDGPPFFLFYSMHTTHFPLEVPQAYVDAFSFIDDGVRRLSHAMGKYLDDAVGEVIDTLKARGLWDNTLVVFHSDNGGEIIFLCGGNNYPLRGGKFSTFDGGIRVNAFVTGGALPAPRRGVVDEQLATIWDFYATYAFLAGVDPTDHAAAAAGLPPHDSLNLWPWLSGENATSPRTEVVIGDTTAETPNGDGATLVGGLIQGDLKLLLGPPNKNFEVTQDVVTGWDWPNTSSVLLPLLHSRVCGRTPATGCLFNLREDPSEATSLAAAQPAVFASMLARVDELQQGVYSPVRGDVADPLACTVALRDYGGYWGPFLP
jgi:arylsulfatase B